MKYLFLLLILISFSAKAQVDYNFEATVTVKRLFTLTQQTKLNFGTVYVSPISGGDIILNKNDSIYTRSSNLLNGGQRSGVYQVLAGQPNSTINITSVRAVLTNGSSVINLDIDVNRQITLDSSGNAKFPIGGKINLPPNTPSGVYTGIFTLRVDYQ